jgi:hypothetical protein
MTTLTALAIEFPNLKLAIEEHGPSSARPTTAYASRL